LPRRATVQRYYSHNTHDITKILFLDYPYHLSFIEIFFPNHAIPKLNSKTYVELL